MDQALPVGSQILDGQYCLTRLLYQRPRVNLYLGRRLALAQQHETGAAGETRKRRDEPLVAIRELVLTGLPAEARTHVEQAAWEEFVSPGVVSSLHLSGTGERMWLRSEHERHYLLMQLHAGNEAHISHIPNAISTLADLLQQQRWPRWLDTQTALAWGIRLCRIVARLHRLGTVLGDLNPATVLIDQQGIATWSPLLLVFWPPSPQFWTPSYRDRAGFEGRMEGVRRVEASSTPTNHEHAVQYFPIASPSFESAFAAPELATGAYDGRADVYALGAMLYLLLTGCAPASAMRRCLLDGYTSDSHNASNASNVSDVSNISNASNNVGTQFRAPVGWGRWANEANLVRGVYGMREAISIIEGLELIPPRLLSSNMPTMLENIVLRSLALDPTERYSSVFALIEALEAVQERQESGQVTRKAFRWKLFDKKH